MGTFSFPVAHVEEYTWLPWEKKFARLPVRVSGKWVWREYYYERDNYLSRKPQRGTIFDVLKTEV